VARENPYVERLIETIRRDCLDHVIVVNERHLKRILADYVIYYHSRRRHLPLEIDCPKPREIQAADRSRVVEFPEIVREGQAVAICRRRDAGGTLPALPVSGARTGPLRGGRQPGDRKERSHVRRP
jgi:hypothetical protein